jgi:predicted ATPase
MSLAADLVQLETADLVRRLEEAELTYQFRHALTQDAAYALLLKPDRVRLHRVIAQAYETFYADRLDEYASVLAEHYAVAGSDAKAMEYSMRAGDVAGRVYAHTEALAQYTRALSLARRVPGAHSQLLCDLLQHRGRVLELSSQFKEALEHYEEMQALAQTRGDRALELAALAAQCQIRCTPNPEFNPD